MNNYMNSFNKIKHSIFTRHMTFMRGERIVSSSMHREKYIELTFDSKGDLYYIKSKVHI